jgi:hypothetical protein
MISSEYTIDYSGWFEEGGYCQIYPIFGHKGWAFKEFHTKKKAEYAHKTQKRLSKYDLAPKVYSGLCRLEFHPEEDVYQPDPSDWGYITELATVPNANTIISMRHIQNLVEKIQEKTKLKFWDCHWSNVGIVRRNGRNKVVCIDTGKESFDGCANAWGFADPGPKCSYCLRYQCRCSEY